MADPAVAQLVQVINGEDHPRVVVGDHRRDSPTVDGPIDQDQGKIGTDQLLDQGVAPTRGREEHAVDLSLEQNGLGLTVLLFVVVGVGEHEGVPGFGEPIFGSPHHRGEERVRDVGDQHPDGEGPSRLETARDTVHAVTEGLRRPTDPLQVSGLTIEAVRSFGAREAVATWTPAAFATSCTPGCRIGSVSAGRDQLRHPAIVCTSRRSPASSCPCGLNPSGRGSSR